MIPFKGSLEISNNPKDFCTQKRIRETLRFMEFPEGDVGDMGEENLVKVAIEDRFHVIVYSLYGWDFNKPVCYGGRYDTILCFEVIEHLMNPLTFAESLHALTKDRGALYLSTPLHNRFGFFFNDTEHFVEFRADKLKQMMRYVGFEVEREKVFRSIPFWKGMLTGGGLFRTFIRVISTKTQLYKFRRKQ